MPTNREFFDAVFHGVEGGAFAWGCAFKSPPEDATNKEWFGRKLTAEVVERNGNYNGGKATNAFYAISSFKPNSTGRVFRRIDNFAATHVITLDDIGDGDSAKISWEKVVLTPSFVIETSPNNCQVGYILKTPCEDMDLVERCVDALIYQGLAAEKDPGMKGVTRYVRFPVGVNNKAKYGEAWQQVVREWNPDTQYNLDEIIEAYGLELAPPSRRGKGDMPEIDAADDPYVAALKDVGLALRDDLREGTKLDILCPFHDDHTDRVDQGTVYMVGGGFKCMHGHCVDRPSADFVEKLREDYNIDVAGELSEVRSAANDKAVIAMFDDETGGEIIEAGLCERLLKKIKRAKEPKLTTKIPKMVRMASLTTIERELVAKAYQARFLEVTGVRLAIGAVRSDLMPVTTIDNGTAPEWCQQWVYIESHAMYGQILSGRMMKAEGFNNLNGKNVPLTPQGTKQSATKFVADWGYVKHVHATAYLPMFEDRVCRLDGEDVLNTFKVTSVPDTAKVLTKAGKKVIKRIRQHVRFICGNDEDAEILMQWLAFQVQFPGQKILWSPVIQSIPGVGKSMFGELLGLVLGDRNVGVVSPQQAVSSFNGWATNVCVNVLEELRIQGHNRYEALNAVKPLITDKKIQINEKNVKPFTTLNTTNYICFTNFKDALPLDENDRRWWVIFTEITSLDDIEQYVGENKKPYFDKLFNGMRAHPDELRKWLLEYPISDDFLSIKQAPMTAHKEAMIATEEASVEGLSEVKEMICQGGAFYNEVCVSTSDLFGELMFEYPELTLNNTQKANIMKRLGFTKVTRLVKIDGAPKRLWTRRQLSNEEIREIFSK